MLMCILLHLLICTALRAHIIVVEALYKINYYYYPQRPKHLSDGEKIAGVEALFSPSTTAHLPFVFK